MLEGGSIKRNPRKKFKGTQTAWKKFFKSAANIAVTIVGKAVSTKTIIPRVRQATTNFLKSIYGGNILTLTGIHGHGLPL